MARRRSRSGSGCLSSTALRSGWCSSICASRGTGAATGLVIYFADDDELRTLTFWGMGSLGGATWQAVGVALPFLVAALGLLPRLARALNALLLGEADASGLGVDVERVKRRIVLCIALAVGASVALTGVIGFVGLVVPHLLRLLLGADHRHLLPGAALLGAGLLVGADLGARTLIAPAELPIGILTSWAARSFSGSSGGPRGVRAVLQAPPRRQLRRRHPGGLRFEEREAEGDIYAAAIDRLSRSMASGAPRHSLAV